MFYYIIISIMPRPSLKKTYHSRRRQSKRRALCFGKRGGASNSLTTLQSNDFSKKNKLPILQYNNIHTYPKWGQYIQRVYKQGILQTSVNLNHFTWFYYNAPFETMPMYRTQNLCITWENSGDTQDMVWLGELEVQYSDMKTSQKELYKLTDNDAFVGVFKYILSSALLRRATNYGFFVRRNTFNIDYIKRKLFERKKIEILHVKEDESSTIAWFWLVKGSGIFLDVSFAKNIVVLHDRRELDLYKNVKSKTELDYIDTHTLQCYMRTHQIDVLVFFKANGVPEMVVRHEKVVNDNTFCLPEQMFTTGLNGKLFMHRDKKKYNFPMLHITPIEHPPVWFTEPENNMYKSLLADEHVVLSYLYFFVAEYGTDTFRELLKKWFPIWYYHPQLKRWIDFLATPLLFAYVKNDASLTRFIESHVPVKQQLLYKHPHNANVNVNDILFSYTSIYPELATIALPITKTVYIVVPYVSQHFWHFMMGEFLPVIAVILNTVASKVFVVKQSFYTCPFNSFYTELNINVGVINHLPPDTEPSIVYRPMRWNYFNQGQKTLLIRVVDYLKDWSMSDTSNTSSSSSTDEPPGIIIQDRAHNPSLLNYFADTFAKEYKKASFEEIEKYVDQSTSAKHKSVYSYNTYGATERQITNLKDIAKDIKETHKSSVVNYQTDDHLTLKEQIQTYQSASTLVLGHGSGMLHILWMRPHSKVLEIIPKQCLVEKNGYRDGCRRLCDMMGFRLKRIMVDDNIVTVDKRLVQQELVKLLK